MQDRHAKQPQFKNPTLLIHCVRYSLYAQIAIATIFILMGVLGGNDEPRAVKAGVLYVVVAIVSGVTILSWVYRVNYNAQQLGAQDMDFSPAWSIGYYFIPFFNIRQPYLAMDEIWKASTDPHKWREQKTPALLWMWWFTWLMYGAFLSCESLYVNIPLDDWLIRSINSTVLAQVINVIEIILAFLFLAIVNAVHDMQMKRHLQLVPLIK